MPEGESPNPDEIERKGKTTSPHAESAEVSRESFEPQKPYEEIIIDILRADRGLGMHVQTLKEFFAQKYWGGVGYDPKKLWTPERNEKLEAALEKVAVRDTNDQWHLKNDYEDKPWLEKKLHIGAWD